MQQRLLFFLHSPIRMDYYHACVRRTPIVNIFWLTYAKFTRHIKENFNPEKISDDCWIDINSPTEDEIFNIKSK